MPSNWEWGLPPGLCERARAKDRSALEKLAPEVFTQSSAAAQIELREFHKTYHRLAMEHHPDRGGVTLVMQAIKRLRQSLKTDIEQALPLILSDRNRKLDNRSGELQTSPRSAEALASLFSAQVSCYVVFSASIAETILWSIST